MPDEDPREVARRNLREAQAQYEAVIERMTDYKEIFRDERDTAIRKAVAVRISKAEIGQIVGASPQWVNKVLRGEAYRRRSD